MIDLGIVKPGATVYIPFGSYAGSTGASAAASNYADADILIYKNGSTTQVAGGTGWATTTFDTITGINLCKIDLADNSLSAGFFAAGADYFVIIGPITVDTQTVNFPIAHFTIGMPGAVLNTTIATLSTQTSFTLTNGPAEDDALNGCVVYIHDVASAVQGGFAVVSDYTGASKTVTLVAGTTFTAAATDNISVFPPVSVAQFGGVNITQSGGRPEVNTTHAAGTAWGSGAITAASIAADAITAAKIATGAIDADAIADNAIDAGAIATGAITSAKFAAGAIDAAAIADGAIDAGSIAAGALDGKGNWNVGKTGYSLTATTGLGNQTADITGNLSGSVGSVTGAVGSVTAAVAITSNIKVNQALAGFEFLMTDSTNHAPATGLTVTVTRSINGGAFGAGTLSAVTEIGNGIYSVDFGAGDLNGKVITLQATAAGADTTFERIVTQA